MGSDPRALRLSEVLAEHGEFVRGLARRLVGSDEADDVAQETFVRLIEHPPARADSPRAWLVTVTRNLVRARGLARARRRSREEDAARAECLPSVAQEVEQAELVKLVVTSAMDLEEPYRETILCRFLRGWSAERTAEAGGVTVATVRSREQRALRALRRKLDRHFESRQAWIGLLLHTFEPKSGSVPLAPPRAAALALGTGVLVVTAAVAAFTLRGSAARPSGARAEPFARSEPAAPATTLLAPVAAARRPAEQATSAAAPATAELGEIRGRLDAPGGAPAAGVRLKLHGWPASRERELLHGVSAWSDLTTESDGTGTFAFHFDPPGALQFAITVEDERYAELGWRIAGLARGARHDLAPAELEPAGTLEGVLLGADGQPVTGQPLLLWLERPERLAFETLSERAEERLYAPVARADGSFRFTRVPSGEHRLHFEHRLVEHAGPRVRLAPGATLRVEFPCPALDSPRALALQIAWHDLGLDLLRAPPAVLRLLGPDGESCTPDARGRFTGLGPGPHRLELEHPWFEPIALEGLEPDRSWRVELRGRSRARLLFRLPAGAAEPAPERVLVRYPTSGRTPDAFVAHAGPAPLVDGLVGDLIPGDVELLVRLPGLGERCAALPGLAAGETRTVTLDFTRATGLVGRVQHADGEPLVGLAVELLWPARKDDSAASTVLGGPPVDASHDPWRRLHTRVLTDEDGRYRFDLPAGGRFALRVVPPVGATLASEAFEIAEDELLTRDVLVPRVVALSGRVRGASDVPLERLRLWACPASNAQAQGHDLGLETAVPLDAEGRFSLECAAGEWRLLIALPAEELAGDARSDGRVGGTRELGRVTLHEGQPAVVELTLGAEAPVRHDFVLHANGAPASRVRLTLRDEHGFDVQGTTESDGRVRLWLFPGDHELFAGTFEWCADLGPHAVRPGTPGERRLELELARARVRFLDGDGAALVGRTVGLFLPGSEDVGWSLFQARPTDEQGTLEFNLAPGSYGFALEPLGAGRQIVPLEWSTDGPLVPELRLPSAVPDPGEAAR